MALDRAILGLAKDLADQYYRDFLEYRESCEKWAREGYRPHYCEHGTNQWTDWDNICGPCEDGLTMADGVQRREAALDSAKRRHAEFGELIAAWELFRKRGIKVDDKALADRLATLLTVKG